MRYLAGARRLADGDLCGTVMRYNGGHGLKRMSRATTIYCNKVKRVLGLPTEAVPTEARDDGARTKTAKRDEDAKRSDNKRNDKTVKTAKREKSTDKVVASAQRKNGTADKQVKTAERKPEGKAAKAKANVKTAEVKQGGKTAYTKSDAKVARATRDKSAERKIVVAEAKHVAAGKHAKGAEARQQTPAKKTKLADATDRKIATEGKGRHDAPRAKGHDRKRERDAANVSPGAAPAPQAEATQAVPTNGGLDRDAPLRLAVHSVK